MSLPDTSMRGDAGERMIQVGQKAPEFTLASDRGGRVSLAELRARGPVALVFYPGDSTPLCTRQLCEFRDAYAELEAAGVSVVGLNPFGEGSHRRFAERHRFPFPLLVDQGLRVARAYGVGLGWGPVRMVRRSVFLVGTDGRVLFAEPGKPPPSRVLAALAPAAASHS